MNTVLLVIVLLLVVGFGVWWVTTKQGIEEPAPAAGIEINLPADNSNQ